MKKLLLIIAILFIAITSVSAQTKPLFFFTKFVSVGYWNEAENKYDWSKGQTLAESIQIYIRGTVIMVYDKAESSYTLTKVIDKKVAEKYTSWLWNARDEKNRNCNVKIVKYNDGSGVVLAILYNDTAFMYMLENN